MAKESIAFVIGINLSGIPNCLLVPRGIFDSVIFGDKFIYFVFPANIPYYRQNYF